jgi:signal recognition particle subunit SRP54
MDGDARGGGALSISEITGKPIKFISEGEKPAALEEFHADRMAKRILGMGDMVSLIEKAQQAVDEQMAAEEAERLAKAELTFDDFIMINQQVRKMGGIGSLLKALPGGERALAGGQIDEGAFDKMVVIINSMTIKERAKPSIINGSRRQRIANGAGVQVFDVNQLIKQFEETRKMMKKLNATQNVPQKKGKKGKKGKKTRNPMRNLAGITGLKGMTGGDLKAIEDLLGK